MNLMAEWLLFGPFSFFCNFGPGRYAYVTEEAVSSYRDDVICVFMLPLSVEGKQKSKQGKQDYQSPLGQFQ